MPVTTTAPAPSYRRLFAVPGFRRLAGATVVARTGSAMQALVLVLFVLQRYHSPALAGVVVFLSIVPGLLLSPVAGALLDRHRRLLLIRLDYALAACVLALIAGLDALGRLPSGLLLVLVALGSLSNPLSNSGTRSLFPMIVPRSLWGRVNAVDSSAYVVASIAGPALAGVLVGTAGPDAAIAATASLSAVGFGLLLAMTEPMLDRVATGALMADALAGLRYVVRNRDLRGIAVATSVMNVGFGILSVALPVLVLSQLHQGASSVGAMYAVMGAAGLLASVLSGRVASAHREVWLVLCGCVLSTMAMTIMLLAAGIGGGLVVVTLGMALFGISQGPYDVGMFSLRQRVTAPSWMGRAFAVSMALNFIGMPIGSAVAGPLAERSVSIAFALAVLANLVSGGAALLLLRPRAVDRRI